MLYRVCYVQVGCYLGVGVPLPCAIGEWFLVVVVIDIGTYVLWLVRPIFLLLVFSLIII